MATSRVETFASELKLDVDVLLEQLKTAGVNKSSGADLISESDKEKLLEALRKAHGGVGDAPRRKITITKRQTSEIRQADPSGKSRTIQVEVRKKRVFVKRDEQESTEKPAVDAAPVLSEEEIQEREAEALRQRALLERQEEERLAKAKEEAEKAERLPIRQPPRSPRCARFRPARLLTSRRLRLVGQLRMRSLPLINSWKQPAPVSLQPQ